jgi:predicted dienelactone hydrolase
MKAVRLAASLVLVSLFILVSSFVLNLRAQQTVSASREDGHATPLLVYQPDTHTGTCAPLFLISHGAGGSENGYRYLAEAMQQAGYTTIVMGHRESGLDALKSDLRTDGIKDGVRNLVTDKNAEQTRLLDVSAALRWADAQCRAPFRVLLGHSMGSSTVMLEVGAKNLIGVQAPLAGRDRFDAYVALSPQGPGIVFPDRAWSGIRKPMLILTGTNDQGLQGGPEARQIPWHELPGTPQHCQWMGVIDGATHMNFAGVGFGANHVDPLVTQTVNAFLTGVHTHACTLPPAAKGMTLESK